MTGTFADVETVSWGFVFAVVALVAAARILTALVRAWRDDSDRLDHDLQQMSDDLDRDRLRAVDRYTHRKDAT